jgi:uncharacterized protein YraI
MHRPSVISSLTVLLLAACGIASAQNAYTSRPIDVHAGPDQDYPLVAQLGPGAPLDVHGCLSDWSWCDVSFEDDDRGWVYADGVSFVYEGDRVPLYAYAPRLGLPIITFSLGAYWGHYYRERPWYSQRDTWEHRRLPPHMRPPGRPGMGAVEMPHGRTAPMGHEDRSRMNHEHPMPMSHEHPAPMTHESRPPMQPDRAHSAPRVEERGRLAPPPGRAPEQHEHAPEQHGHASRPSGPPGDRGRSGHGDHGDHGNRPPGSDR